MKKKLIAILLITISIFTVTFTQLPALADYDVNIQELEQCNQQINNVLTYYNTTTEEQLNILENTYSEELSQSTNEIQSIKINKLKTFTNDIRLCSIFDSEQTL